MSNLAERNVDHGYASVRSRISWGAILAGVAVALAVYTLLIALGVAVGMSVSDDVNLRSLGTGAGVWGFISLLVSLFTGGWVTTQVTAGETRTEAVLYGVVLWATTSVLLLWLTANGVQAGMNATIAARGMSGANQAVMSADQEFTPEDQRVAFERAREAGKEGAWWAFAGILLSMVAAIGGALVGPVELTVRRDTRHIREQHTPVT